MHRPETKIEKDVKILYIPNKPYKQTKSIKTNS
jgi:hypothetical protein